MKKAIILNSFGRGGSSIVSSIIASSPQVIYAGEFWKFYYRMKNFAPAVYRRFGVPAGKLISDVYFHREVFENRLMDSINIFIDNDFQLRRCRGMHHIMPSHVVFKVTEYDMFLNDKISKSFDDVKFIGLIRNGFGVCESWKRRGVDPLVSGKMYNHLARFMIDQSKTNDRFKIIKFDDILCNLTSSIDFIYNHIDVDKPPEDSFITRFKGHGVGREDSAGMPRQTKIINVHDLEKYIDKNVEVEAIKRLSGEDIYKFNKFSKSVMEILYGGGKDQL